MWKLFPRLIEQKINTLLDEAEPNRIRAYQIYKSCQNENLWNESFGKFSEHLTEFFSKPKSDRNKSQFDVFLNRPMHKSIFASFTLDFRNAIVDDSSVLKVSSWAHHMMRINCKSESQIISPDIMKRTIDHITNPSPFEKAQDIEFDDFCAAWKKVVFAHFGRRHDLELNRLLETLEKLNNEQKIKEISNKFLPKIYLTQTEIDWTESVKKAAEDFNLLPKFPLSKGPQKQQLKELENIVKLYNIVIESDKPQLISQRQNVRATVIFRCDELKLSRAS